MLIVKKLFRLFLHGLLALLPLGVTLLAVSWLLGLTVQIAGSFLFAIPGALRSNIAIEVVAHLVSLAAIIGALTIFGILMETIFGKGILAVIDRFARSIPGVNWIYGTAQQVVELFSKKKSSGTPVRPVLVEYPARGVWVVAFRTGEADLRTPPTTDHPCSTVFIPTCPNPTSGFMCVYRTDTIRELPVSVDQAVKFILTAGAVKL